jgi:hypothetical protein
MGLYPQPNKWQCGPFALKYSLIMLGKIVDEKEVSRIAGSHWWTGTDEIKLGRAAKAFECELKLIRRSDALEAKRELLLSLYRGRPALLCVDGWNHWITVVGAERGRCVYFDSRKAPVVRIDTWPALRKRWAYAEVDPHDRTRTRTLFDLHPVIPRFRVRSKARFSLKRARYLRRAENHVFATHWDEYFTDLSHICTPRTPLSARVFPMGELLRRHSSMIRQQVSYWHGHVNPRHLSRILRNYQFVADTYDLVVREEDEKRTVVAIAVLIALWAASKVGIGDIYGSTS